MREKLIYCLGAVVALLFIRNLFVILTVLPDEANQGAIFRIIYFHVPAAITSFTTRIGARAPIFGLRYLASRGKLFSISCK